MLQRRRWRTTLALSLVSNGKSEIFTTCIIYANKMLIIMVFWNTFAPWFNSTRVGARGRNVQESRQNNKRTQQLRLLINFHHNLSPIICALCSSFSIGTLSYILVLLNGWWCMEWLQSWAQPHHLGVRTIYLICRCSRFVDGRNVLTRAATAVRAKFIQLNAYNFIQWSTRWCAFKIYFPLNIHLRTRNCTPV